MIVVLEYTIQQGKLFHVLHILLEKPHFPWHDFWSLKISYIL